MNMPKQPIQTNAAPAAIGTYSQAVYVNGGTAVYVSGQIGLDPSTLQLEEGIDAQTKRVLENLKAVATAAGCELDDMLKLTVYLTDLAHFTRVNEIMATHFRPPYPARATIGVAALPRGALIEMDAVMNLK
jgi:reactive intermediate/imine deaminase